jgi:hypothetical protein
MFRREARRRYKEPDMHRTNPFIHVVRERVLSVGTERGRVLVSAVGDPSIAPVPVEGRTGDWPAWSGPPGDAGGGSGTVGIDLGGPTKGFKKPVLSVNARPHKNR